jgi:hypothetical protein
VGDRLEAIKIRAFRVIDILSPASLTDMEVMRQRATALNTGQERQEEFILPLDLGVTLSDLDRQTASLRRIPFAESWSQGLQQLLQRLEAAGCPRPVHHGRSIAADMFFDRATLTNKPETIVSNCFQTLRLPATICLFETSADIAPEKLETFEGVWSFRAVTNRRFLSFQRPPEFVSELHPFKMVSKVAWRRVAKIQGISSLDLATELIRKALPVKCHEKGLIFCPTTKLWYFPKGLLERDRLPYELPNNSRAFIQVAGQRKYWRPKVTTDYCYYLAPTFNVRRDIRGDFVALLQVRVRFSDTSGEVLPKKAGQSRRKHLCRDWWNHEWLTRTMAIAQYLATEDTITIGEVVEQQIVFSATPLLLSAPVGIDESRLGDEIVDPEALGFLLEGDDFSDEDELEEGNG